MCLCAPAVDCPRTESTFCPLITNKGAVGRRALWREQLALPQNTLGVIKMLIPRSGFFASLSRRAVLWNSQPLISCRLCSVNDMGQGSLELGCQFSCPMERRLNAH